MWAQGHSYAYKQYDENHHWNQMCSLYIRMLYSPINLCSCFQRC